MNKDSLQELALSDLMPEKTKEGIERAAALYQKAQESMYVLAAEKDETDLTRLKIGTVLALSVLRKIAEGTIPISFTPSDWEEIAHSVADYAVLTDGGEYSVFIFTQYFQTVPPCERSPINHFSLAVTQVFAFWISQMSFGQNPTAFSAVRSRNRAMWKTACGSAWRRF